MNSSQLTPFFELATRIAPKKLSETSLVALLPLLEYSLPLVQRDGDAAFRQASVIGADECLPLDELVSFALQAESSYWSSLAIDWAIAGFPTSAEVQDLLVSLARRTDVPQALRHNALSVLKTKTTNKPWDATGDKPAS